MCNGDTTRDSGPRLRISISALGIPGMGVAVGVSVGLRVRVGVGVRVKKGVRVEVGEGGKV